MNYGNPAKDEAYTVTKWKNGFKVQFYSTKAATKAQAIKNVMAAHGLKRAGLTAAKANGFGGRK